MKHIHETYSVFNDYRIWIAFCMGILIGVLVGFFL